MSRLIRLIQPTGQQISQRHGQQHKVGGRAQMLLGEDQNAEGLQVGVEFYSILFYLILFYYSDPYVFCVLCVFLMNK
jgi:hypothetical protein